MHQNVNSGYLWVLGSCVFLIFCLSAFLKCIDFKSENSVLMIQSKILEYSDALKFILINKNTFKIIFT